MVNVGSVGSYWDRFGENLEKLIFKNILMEFKEKYGQIWEKWLRILKSLGWRLHENFQNIFEKVRRYFLNVLDKTSDNLIKYCV